MNTRTPSTEHGFSLVELLIAMTVTLIITGAVYGLIAGGQNAFRREPELTDRQQNIRVAMDVIMKDLAGAGTNMAPWAQVFRNNPSLDGVGPSPAGVVTDFVEFLANDGSCPDMRIQAVNGAVSPATVTSASTIPNCYGTASLISILFNDRTSRWGWASGITPLNAAARTFNVPTAPNAAAKFDSTLPNAADVGVTANVFTFSRVQLVRYEIANAAGDLAPSLWRSDTGGRDATGTLQAAPAATGNWQLIARGIEDMQVDYMVNGAWVATPAAVAVNAPATVTTQVRVALSARSEAPNIQGAINPQAGTSAARLRGRLVSVAVPRSALVGMSSPAPGGNWQ